MRRASALPCTRNVLVALTVAARRQGVAGVAANSAPEPSDSVTVRSQGYGPSSDLVKGVSSSSSLYVEAALHPQDAEIQRRVLALSRPDVEHITVAAARPDTGYAFLPFIPEQGRTTTATSAPAPATAALSAQLSSMEAAWQEQLASVANVVVEQVVARTASQLRSLELAQGEEGRTLAQLVIDALRDEMAAHASHTATEGTPTEARHAPAEADAEAMAQRVAQRVAAAMQVSGSDATSSTMQATVEQLEARMMRYLAALEERVKAAVRNVASNATPTPTTVDAAGMSADQLSRIAIELRRDVVNAVEQTTQAQREHLSAMLEDALRARNARSDPTAANFDMDALQDSIEGALHAATDNIRLGVTAELKKWAKTKGRNISADGDDGKAASDGALQGMLSRLSDSVAQSFSTGEATLQQLHNTDDAVQSVLAEQRRMAALVAHMKEQLAALQLLDRGETPSQEGRQTAEAAGAAVARVGSELGTAMTKMQDRLRRLCETVEGQAEQGDRQREQEMLAMARAMSESVSAAVSARTTASLEAALTRTQTQLDELAHRVAAAQAASAAAATAVEAVQRRQSSAPEWEASTRAVVQQSVATALQEALAPQLKQLLDRVDFWQHEARAVQEQHMLTLASTLSEAVRAALAAHAPDHAALAALRADLTTTLQTEMSKTHEVDLTPMYKYIDSMLVFVKDELTKVEGTVGEKVVSLGDSVSGAVQHAQSAQTARLDELIRTTVLQELRAMTAEMKTATTASQQASNQLQADLTAQLRAIPAAVEHHAMVIVDRLQHSLQSSETRAAVERVEQGITALSSRAEVQQLGSSLEGSVRDAVGALATKLDRSIAGAVEDVKAELHAAVTEATVQRQSQLQESQSHLVAQWHTQRGELDEDATRRNAKLLEAIRSSAAVENQATQAQLATLQDSLTKLTTAQQTTLHAQLERIVQSLAALQSSAEQHDAKTPGQSPSRELSTMQAALDRVNATLAEQTKALRALQEAASTASTRATTATEEGGATTPHSAHLTTTTATVATIVAQMQRTVAQITALMPRVEGARAAQVGPLLQQLRTHVSDLHNMQHRLLATQSGVLPATDGTATAAATPAPGTSVRDSERGESESPLSSKDAVATATALESLRGEAETRLRAATEAVVQAVQAETASLARLLTEHTATLKSERETDHADLTDAIDKLTHTLRADVAALAARPPPLTAHEAQTMAEAQGTRLTDAVYEVDARTRDALHNVSVAVAAAQSASTATQQLVQDELKRMQQAHEAHTTRTVREGLDQQLEALQAFVARTVATSVHDSTAAVARRVEDVLERQRASAQAESVARRDAEDRARQAAERARREREEHLQDKTAAQLRPSAHAVGATPVLSSLWWWLLNPLLVCGTMLLCAYFLFACFLLAFVPLPEPARDGGTATTMPDALSLSLSSSIAAAAAVDADEDAAAARRRRGRRVADSVM